MSLGCFRCSSDRAAVTSLTNPHHFTELSLFVFRTSPAHGTVGMLILPFRKYIWTGILILEVFKVTFLLFTYKLARQLYELVYPYSYGVSLMNNIAIILGMPIKDVRRGNLSRYLLLLWILFNFVIRNGYTARLFDLMTIVSQNDLPQGFDDLLRMGYKLFMSNATFATVRNVSSALRFNMESIHFKDAYSFVEYMLERKESYLKYAGITPIEFIRLYNRRHGYKDEVYILPEIVFNQNLCIYFSKHSFLVRRVDYILLNMRSMGLISYWAKKDMRHERKNGMTRKNADDPLDIQDFSGIFYLTFSGLIISCFAFICELLIGRYSKNSFTDKAVPKKNTKPRTVTFVSLP